MIKGEAVVEKTKYKPTSFTADDALMERVDAEMGVRKLHNRSEALRALISEGLHRAAVRRKKGLSVEVGEKGAGE